MDSGCISMCWGAFSCSTVSSGKTGYQELGYPALEARSRQAPGIPEHIPISLLVQAKSFKVGSLGVAGVLKTAFLQHLLDLGGWVDVLKSGSLGARYLQSCRLSCKCLPGSSSKREQLVLGGHMKCTTCFPRDLFYVSRVYRLNNDQLQGRRQPRQRGLCGLSFLSCCPQDLAPAFNVLKEQLIGTQTER